MRALFVVATLTVSTAVGRPVGAFAQQAEPEGSPWITEFGLSVFVTSPPGLEDRRALVAWEVGREVGPLAGRPMAAGAFLVFNDNQLRAGARARYTFGADTPRLHVGPGLILLHSDDDLDVEPRLGGSLEVGLQLGHLVTFAAEAEAVGGGSAVRLGGRADGWLGAVTGVAVPLLILLLIRDD